MVSSTWSDRLKILHVIPAVAARYGGPSQAIFQMCRALGTSGVEVLVATTDSDGPGRLPVETSRISSYQDVDTIFFPVRFTEKFSYSPKLARWLDETTPSFDLVHIHAIFSHPSLAAAIACQKLGVPYVVRPLGSLDPWSLRQKPWRKQAMWQMSVKRMLQRAAAIHYTSGDERQLAEGPLGLTNGVVIPLGVDLPAAPNQHRQTGPYVLVLSRLHPKKNLEALIEAFGETTDDERFSDWRLVIAGDGESDYVNKLKMACSNSSARQRIVFAGWVSGAERENLLSGAELLALPSRQENFGLCVAEALAHAVPVIISDRVNFADHVRAAGAGWVTSLEPDSISAALQAAMCDPAERIRRGEAGRQLVTENFSWRKVAASLIELYERTLNAQKVARKPLVEVGSCDLVDRSPVG
jgi:glycosyltransferase involved in cell wall biosynthesis